MDSIEEEEKKKERIASAERIARHEGQKPIVMDLDQKEANLELKGKQLSEAIERISVEDFKHLPEIPCARNALLYGIGTGAGVGSLRYIASRGQIRGSTNWAVMSFVTVSLVSFQLCRWQRSKEKENMKALMERRAKPSKSHSDK